MTTQKKYPLPSAEQEDIEEALGCLWEQKQKGELHKSSCLLILEEAGNQEIYSKLIEHRFIEEKEDKIVLTDSGENLGRDMIRRHRLAERLLSDVLSLSNQAIDPNACKLEHILSIEVTESICTLLGHPRQCPHGSEIPIGECCKKAEENIGPIITSLDKFHVGTQGKIAYLTLQSHPDLHKLLSLGLIPGALFNLHQIYPTFVLEVGETTIALEKEIAEKIFVRNI